MNEQDVTYSELKFHSPSEQQNRQTAEKPKNEDSSSLPPQLQLILAVLGILCLVLLVTVGVLGAKVFQNEYPNKQHEILENLTQLQKTLKICQQQRDDLQSNYTNLTGVLNIKVQQNEDLSKQSEIVDNITQQLGICHQQRDDLQAKDTDLTNIVNMKGTQLPLSKENESRLNLHLQHQQLQTRHAISWGDNCRPCPESWIHHGEKCYHFSKEKKTWEKSKEHCSSWGSLLLKIENTEELDFIKSQATFCWIGLSRAAQGHNWVWQDGTAHSTSLFAVNIQEPGEKCAVFKDGKAFSYNCTGQYCFICKKRAT